MQLEDVVSYMTYLKSRLRFLLFLSLICWFTSHDVREFTMWCTLANLNRTNRDVKIGAVCWRGTVATCVKPEQAL